jgi:hypothetical protein
MPATAAAAGVAMLVPDMYLQWGCSEVVVGTHYIAWMDPRCTQVSTIHSTAAASTHTPVGLCGLQAVLHTQGGRHLGALVQHGFDGQALALADCHCHQIGLFGAAQAALDRRTQQRLAVWRIHPVVQDGPDASASEAVERFLAEEPVLVFAVGLHAACTVNGLRLGAGSLLGEATANP